jgi:hypothetical protein
MPYNLVRLAPGSYDVLLDGVVVASLVRSGKTHNATWTAELLADLPPSERPTPFTELEHTFGNLEEAEEWLGIIETRDAGEQG